MNERGREVGVCERDAERKKERERIHRGKGERERKKEETGRD